MADATPTPSTLHKNRNQQKWVLDQASTSIGGKIQGGEYSLTMEGVFDGASIEWEYAKVNVDGNFHSLDVTNLTYTANKTYNMKIAQGFLRPKRTGGGASTAVTAYASPIPDSEA